MAVCVAVVPVPLTGFVCFPAAALLAVCSIYFGILALREPGVERGRGKALALSGVILSAGSILLATCSGLVVVFLGLRLTELLANATR